MASDLNTVSITARLTRDPELRSTAGGTSVANMRVAVNGREKQGEEWGDYPNFFDVTVFGRQAEACDQYLEKGKRVAVEGRLRWREWEDKQGNSRQSVEIVAREVVFISPLGEDGGTPARAPRQVVPDIPVEVPAGPSAPNDDDKIPF